MQIPHNDKQNAKRFFPFKCAVPIFWTFIILLHFSSVVEAAKWKIDIDAKESDFLTQNNFSKPEIGFTDVVPPPMLRQRFAVRQIDEGCEFELWGTELSVWQAAQVPQNARYALRWHFDYEGRVTEGFGRTGFIFGDPTSANLLSVEITHGGSLRLVRWGTRIDDNHGSIVWSKKVAASGHHPVRIEAEYDIRSDILTCTVNDMKPIRIELTRYMPSAPMTIKAVGFFSAVPEAMRISRRFPLNPNTDIDIETSTKHTKTVHRRLAVSCE